MDDVEAGHAMRLRRAHEHLQWVRTYLEPWTDGNKHTEWLEPDPEVPGNTRVMVTLTEKPAPYPLSVKVGECLHNMRSALDLLAYELACAYTQQLPDDIKESSEFPIFGNRNGQGSQQFHNRISKGAAKGQPARTSGLYKIRGIHPSAKALIERLQPYHQVPDWDSHPLWLLHDLDRISKHRLLHVIAAGGATTLKVVGDGYDPVRDFPFGDGAVHSVGAVELEPGKPTNVGSFPLRSDIRPEQMKVKPTGGFHLTIRDYPGSGPPGEYPITVIDTLNNIYSYVVTDVVAPLAPFL